MRPSATPVALSAGANVAIAGAVVSNVQASLASPAKGVPDKSAIPEPAATKVST